MGKRPGKSREHPVPEPAIICHLRPARRFSPGGATAFGIELRLTDGSIIRFARQADARALVARERLMLAGAQAFAAACRAFRPAEIDFAALLDTPPIGQDSADVVMAKEAAQLQEVLRAAGSAESWQWFKRFCAANIERLSLVVLILRELVRLRRPRQVPQVDWLSELRLVVADAPSVAAEDIIRALHNRPSDERG